MQPTAKLTTFVSARCTFAHKSKIGQSRFPHLGVKPLGKSFSMLKKHTLRYNILINLIISFWAYDISF